MISDEQLDRFRVDGTPVRVVRDADPANDVYGFVVAWDASSVLIRKRMNRRLVKLDRRYVYQPEPEPRALPPALAADGVSGEGADAAGGEAADRGNPE